MARLPDDLLRYHRVTVRNIETAVFEIYGAKSPTDAQRILTDYFENIMGSGRPPHIVRTGEEYLDTEITAREFITQVPAEGAE